MVGKSRLTGEEIIAWYIVADVNWAGQKLNRPTETALA